jgi:DNA-binding beta-propeller fold protein YncE
LDKNSGEIVKYNVRENEEELSPETWLKETTEKKAINAISMAIDENIWVLNKEENITIERYYLGLFKDTISLNIFPELENPTKIWTSPQNPYFYILEPKNNRLIILNKQGEIFKQYQSEKFNHLLDFALSEDGKTIYVLNSSKVYQIEME